MNRNEIKVAIDYLNKAYSINSKNNEIKMKLAEAYFLDDIDLHQKDRNVELSIKLLKQVVEEQPANYQALTILAKALEKQG